MKSKSWKNRIVGYEDVPVSQVLYNARNWRVHPKAQQAALSGVLSDVGVVQNIIINRTTGNLVDGHLRVMLADRNGETHLPATIVELSEAEECEILATLDPLSAMATADREKLDDMLREVHTGEAAVMEMLSKLAETNGMFGDIVGTDAPELADGDRSPFRQMTYTVHDDQFEIIEQAMKQAKRDGGGKSDLNENSNGNALAFICERFIGG